MKSEKKFIKVFDEESANLLLNMGLPQLCMSNGVYIFINNGNMSFSNEKLLKNMIYTNIIEM